MANEIASGDILTPEQLSHNIKVYAGPGAGKTHFLVENVKNIVSTNELITKSNSRKVLCITYTNAAVDEITRRLDKFTEYVQANTIHGFIIDNIIKPFQTDLISIMQSDFNISVNPKGAISSQIEGLGILHGTNKDEIYQFIRDTDPVKFGNTVIDYSKKVMGEVEVNNDVFIEAIGQSKKYEPSIKHSPKIGKEHVVPIKQYIWSVVRKLTHNEILYFGYRILQENPTALYAIRVKFPFIFVDEFQDTNPLQTLLIELVGKKSTHICIVGDIAQSIYSFQGAKPNDFKNFKIDSGRDIDYSISGNRRSTNNIVNFCNFLRQSDTTVVQNSIRKYKSNDEWEKTESNKVNFLIGNSPKIAEVIDRVMSDGGVVLTRTWAAAFDYIKDITEEQSKLLKSIYNSYYNTPIQLRDEIAEYSNVTWVRTFRFIFTLWESYSKGSFIDMLSALKLYSKINFKAILPKMIFELDSLAKETFAPIEKDTITCNVIQNFNDSLKKEAYADLKELILSDEFKIPVFNEQDNEKLVNAVGQLYWDTSYKLFTEVFSEKSRYMTVHQAKGLEWKKVIVSVTPNKFDNISLSDMFSAPQLTAENTSDEFVRMYYVACSRAIDEIYIHIASGCSRDIIEKSLDSYIIRTGLKIEYDFLC
jgi:superfamily I DNA/RNA helicase